jgi:hypothetical protein
MKHLYTILFTAFCFTLASAQESYVHQIIFLNEGWYDFANDTLAIPPSLGSYDPATNTYQVFDEIPEADFASEVLVDDVIYVAADNLLITYDKHNLTRLQQVSIPGIRGMAIWQDQLLVSRGDYLVFFDSYFQVYDRHTLDFIYELDIHNGPQYASENIVVRDDTAYLAINNGFVLGEEVGAIGIIDLKNQTYAGEIDLGPTGINPDNVMLGDERIYTLNNKSYTSSSISFINPETRQVETYDNIAANAGCGTSVYAADHIYYMEYGVDKLARFDVQQAQIVDTLINTAAYYGLIHDEIDRQLIATWTDFVSIGTATILSYEGDVLHTFDVGVSPGSIALDVRKTTGTRDAILPADAISVFPVPVSNLLHFQAADAIDRVELYDVLGNIVRSISADHTTTVSVSMEHYQPGVYIAQVRLEKGGVGVYRVVKE